VILRIHIQGAHDYDVGDEIWQESLLEAITAEAETIAAPGSDLLDSPDRAHRDALRSRIIIDMTSALVEGGDEYRAPDGVRYSLVDEPELDDGSDAGRLRGVSSSAREPVVEDVLRFEDLPLGSAGSRRAIVRWSDGTEGAALTFYADEVLFCEGDHGNSRLMSSLVEKSPQTASSGPDEGYII
jgi:hypothetical protein